MEQWLAKGKNEVPEWVFCNQEGHPADMQNVKNRHFRKCLTKAGLRTKNLPRKSRHFHSQMSLRTDHLGLFFQRRIAGREEHGAKLSQLGKAPY